MAALIAFSFVAVSTTYFLPSIVAFWRGHYRRWTILFLNVILGWMGLVWLYLLLTAPAGVSIDAQALRLSIQLNDDSYVVL